jgi:hypothetical protein
VLDPINQRVKSPKILPRGAGASRNYSGSRPDVRDVTAAHFALRDVRIVDVIAHRLAIEHRFVKVESAEINPGAVVVKASQNN